jgi:hypothetical protein
VIYPQVSLSPRLFQQPHSNARSSVDGYGLPAHGNIVGSGNDRPTPHVVLDILGADRRSTIWAKSTQSTHKQYFRTFPNSFSTSVLTPKGLHVLKHFISKNGMDEYYEQVRSISSYRTSSHLTLYQNANQAFATVENV